MRLEFVLISVKYLTNYLKLQITLTYLYIVFFTLHLCAELRMYTHKQHDCHTKYILCIKFVNRILKIQLFCRMYSRGKQNVKF